MQGSTYARAASTSGVKKRRQEWRQAIKPKITPALRAALMQRYRPEVGDVVAVTMPAVAIDDGEESDEMDDDERPMHEDQDGVWYGRVTTTDDVFEELMLDSAGFAHDTGRRVRKKDREEIQPVIKWIEKSKK